MNNKIGLEKAQGGVSNNSNKKNDFEKLIKRVGKSSPFVKRSTLERKRDEANEAKNASEELARQMRVREQQFRKRIAELEKLLKGKNQQTKELQNKLAETEKDTKKIDNL